MSKNMAESILSHKTHHRSVIFIKFNRCEGITVTKSADGVVCPYKRLPSLPGHTGEVIISRIYFR
jgi:hypothetical protein